VTGENIKVETGEDNTEQAAVRANGPQSTPEIRPMRPSGSPSRWRGPGRRSPTAADASSSTVASRCGAERVAHGAPRSKAQACGTIRARSDLQHGHFCLIIAQARASAIRSTRSRSRGATRCKQITSRPTKTLALHDCLMHKPRPSLGLGPGLVRSRPARCALRVRVPPNEDWSLSRKQAITARIAQSGRADD
jgi:hypothetical protein